tara:strand:+ start:3192 stop:3566 length:375 start_codon:yes stop_codon:yes gene_type:complete
MATLTATLKLVADAGGPFSDAISVSLSKAYTTNEGNKMHKLKLDGSAQQIQVAASTGNVVLVFNNLSSSNVVYVHNSASNAGASTRIANIGTGELAVIPSDGAADIYVTGTADQYLEYMSFAKA